MAFYDSYDYWNHSEDWFVAGYADNGHATAQFKPIMPAVLSAIAERYHSQPGRLRWVPGPIMPPYEGELFEGTL